MMNRARRKKYRLLREIRQERDYQSGKLQFANRPITKPSLTTRWINGELKRTFVTTNQFIKKMNINIFEEVGQGKGKR